MGPNGSGKSTLLRCVAGLEKSYQGNIFFDDCEVKDISPKKRAELISIVLTEMPADSTISVYSLLALGRYPYSGWLGRLSKSDEAALKHAIEVTGIRHLVNMTLSMLSDGERQLCMIARALAQETPFILLDEPTSFLDIPNKVKLMRFLKSLAVQEDKCIIMATHDLDLAIDMADSLWLLSPNGAFFSGTPEDLALNGMFEMVFGNQLWAFDMLKGKFSLPPIENSRMVYLLSEDEIRSLWTRKALNKLDIDCLTLPQNPDVDIPRIEVLSEKNWRISKQKETYLADSLEELTRLVENLI